MIYESYFGRVMQVQGDYWVPEIICKTCEANLNLWWTGKRLQMPFAVPMIWSKPRNHRTDCYFCLTNVNGFSSKNKHLIKYPDCPSALKPQMHGENFPVPVTPNSTVAIEPFRLQPTENAFSLSDSDDSDCEGECSSLDPDYIPEDEPHRHDQPELSDLIRDLGLAKDKSELLASRMLQWNFLSNGTKVTYYRTRNEALMKFFTKENSICHCVDIDGLMEHIGFKHDPIEWRLFIDGSTQSLKAALLHNGNQKPTIPLAHTVDWKESRESIEAILSAIKYDQFEWKVSCDLKVLSILMGLQAGYTKHMCFLCEWDSRADAEHYVKKDWPARTEFVPGECNVEYPPLIDQCKVFFTTTPYQAGTCQKFREKIET